VEGASLLLFCHDDVAPDPDAVHILVEESFRSNAGVVAPKLVSWDDPTKLLHVGMAVDKGGAVVDRMEPGEIDHGQHDAVRDVFLAPGGCTLVRFDLFAELGGFDPDIFAMGEDLDLCWRAQILGARVVVAPGARVRHLEMLASGRRPLPEHIGSAPPDGVDPVDVVLKAWAGADGTDGGRETVAHDGVDEHRGVNGAGGAGEADGEAVAVGNVRRGQAGTGVSGAAGTTTGTVVGAAAGAAVAARRHRRSGAGRDAHGRHASVTLQSLQRRHELHAALKAYGPFHLMRVVPQIALLSLAEFIIAVVTRHRDRASAVAQAWRWNLVNRRALRAARAEVRAHRRIDDATVRRLQLHGSARLNAYVRRAVTHGLQAANIGGAHREIEPMPSDHGGDNASTSESGPTPAEVTA